jgi:hypothetical protein
LISATIDIDGNGYSDLLLARDSGVYLFTNSAGKFTSRKLEIKFNGKSTPVSFALGDINKDGFIDIYISTFYMAGIVRNDKVKIRIVIHVNKNTQKGIMYII